MKKVLLASVASIATASAAMADTPAAVTQAIADINTAYTNFVGTDDGTLAAAFDELLYHVDNHGSVNTVALSGTGDAVEFDGSSDSILNLPELTIVTYDFTSEIAADIRMVQGKINNQFYGDSSKNEGSWEIAYSNGAYVLTGVDSGFVFDDLQELTAHLNTLDTQIDSTTLWNAASLATLDSNVDAIEMDAAELASDTVQLVDTTASIANFAATDAYRMRTAAEAAVTVTNAAGIVVDGAASATSVVVRSAVANNDALYTSVAAGITQPAQ